LVDIVISTLVADFNVGPALYIHSFFLSIRFIVLLFGKRAVIVTVHPFCDPILGLIENLLVRTELGAAVTI
jgi:hypothetical protein